MKTFNQYLIELMTKSDTPSNLETRVVKTKLGDHFDRYYYTSRHNGMIINTSVTQKKDLPQSGHVEFSVDGSIDNTLNKTTPLNAAKILNVVSSHLSQHRQNNREVEGYTYTTDDETKDRIYKKMGQINNFPVKNIQKPITKGFNLKDKK
jgi:hypothetical protein